MPLMMHIVPIKRSTTLRNEQIKSYSQEGKLTINVPVLAKLVLSSPEVNSQATCKRVLLRSCLFEQLTSSSLE